MNQFYTDEKNVLILISLLKEFNIKKVVVSPGSTNVTFVGSIQQDPFFELYSSVDERSAAYIACGLAAETNTPVALSCTGATASRNYFSGLTEAYYRKLPIIAITSTQDISKIGHLIPQVIDRSIQPKDIVKYSVHLQTIKDENDWWDCIIKTNKALLELTHNGGGPIHINLTTTYSSNFTTKTLPRINKINRITAFDTFPSIPKGKIAIFVGSHNRWTNEEINAIDTFCSTHNAVVFSDTSSNYNGKFKVSYQLASLQGIDDNLNPNLLIHIGNISDQANIIGTPKEVWRICEDGEVQDRFRRLSNIFQMPFTYFFNHYSKNKEQVENSYFKSCLLKSQSIFDKIPELPFSHIWVASQLYNKLPSNSTLHLGILSPLRSWSYFNIPNNIEIYCNQGGFGIDGNLSTLIGASLANPNKIYYGVVGDLSFFYDMNVLGNRHVTNNIRILLINNALGAEFILFKQRNCRSLDDVENFISANNHFGKQSPLLVKHYAEDLGFEYLTASSKEEFEISYKRFITPEITNMPMIFEIFTKAENENEALYKMFHIERNRTIKRIQNKIKTIIHDFQ